MDSLVKLPGNDMESKDPKGIKNYTSISGDAQTTILLPSQKNLEELVKRKIDSRVLSPLIVCEDVINVKQYHDGYIAAKKDAAFVNEGQYDIAAGHFASEIDVPDFYNIPILTCDSNADADVFKLIFEELCQTGKRRHFVWTSEKKEPYLVDTYINDVIRHYFISYLTTSFDRLLSKGKEQGESFKSHIENVVKELSRPR